MRLQYILIALAFALIVISSVVYFKRQSKFSSISLPPETIRQTLTHPHPIKTPKDLLIFYGYPSHINQTAGLVNLAIEEYKKYDYVVFGDDIGKTSPYHSERENTMTIMKSLPNTFFFGYVDLGVTTDNHTMTVIKMRMNNWKEMGAKGILIDDFGYDYESNRKRQNDAVDYAHKLGLKVLANGWDPDDIFGNKKSDMNPDGTPTTLNKDDFYLAESYQIIVGDVQKEYEWLDKRLKILSYQREIPFKIMAITTNNKKNHYSSKKFHYAYYSAVLEEFEAIGWGEFEFSSEKSIAPYRSRPHLKIGEEFHTDMISNQKYRIYYKKTDKGSLAIKPSSGKFGFIYK